MGRFVPVLATLPRCFDATITIVRTLRVLGSLGKRIKAALLCKTLPKDDNPAAYVNGSSSSPSRNLVTAIKLAGYVVHCGTGGKVSAVDGDGREVRDGDISSRRAAVCFAVEVHTVFNDAACLPCRFGDETVCSRDRGGGGRMNRPVTRNNYEVAPDSTTDSCVHRFRSFLCFRDSQVHISPCISDKQLLCFACVPYDPRPPPVNRLRATRGLLPLLSRLLPR